MMVKIHLRIGTTRKFISEHILQRGINFFGYEEPDQSEFLKMFADHNNGCTTWRQHQTSWNSRTCVQKFISKYEDQIIQRGRLFINNFEFKKLQELILLSFQKHNKKMIANTLLSFYREPKNHHAHHAKRDGPESSWGSHLYKESIRDHNLENHGEDRPAGVPYFRPGPWANATFPDRFERPEEFTFWAVDRRRIYPAPAVRWSIQHPGKLVGHRR